jgi:hypothetical protein
MPIKFHKDRLRHSIIIRKGCTHTLTHRRQGGLINLFLFFQNKRSIFITFCLKEVASRKIAIINMQFYCFGTVSFKKNQGEEQAFCKMVMMYGYSLTVVTTLNIDSTLLIPWPLFASSL